MIFLIDFRVRFIFQIGLRVILSFCIFFLMRKTRYYYFVENRRNEATRIIFILELLQLFSVLNGIHVSTVHFLMTFYIDQQIFEYVVSLLISYAIFLIESLYSLTFVIRTYSIYPKDFFVKFLILLFGFGIGMLSISIFSIHDWYVSGSPPFVVIGLIFSLIGIVTFLKLMYSWISAKKQKILLIRKSMTMFSIGNLISLFGLLGLTFLFIFGYVHIIPNLIVDILFFIQFFELSMTYIGYFQPSWFKRKYAKESSYIEKLFSKLSSSK